MDEASTVELLGLGDLPGGGGPGASLIVAEEETGPADVAEGRLLVRDDVVFRLYREQDEGDRAPASPVDSRVWPAAPLAELGSLSLPTALADLDLAAVLEALAFDVVIVPVIPDGSGFQARVFPGQGEQRDLYLFSSALTFDAFTAAGAERTFVVREGAAVAQFIHRHQASLADVVLDPGQQRPLTIPAAQLAEIVGLADLMEDPTDGHGPQSSASPVGFAVPLNSQWATLNLADETVRHDQIRRLVKRQTRTLSDRGATLRQDLRLWLERTASQAAATGGRQFAFLIARVKQAAAAVTLVTYWHDLGPGTRPLEVMVEQLAGSAGEGDKLVRLRMGGDEVVRQTRIRSGAEELGGGQVRLLLIDYWIAVPGSGSLAHVSVSTPHLAAAEAIMALTDTLVLNGEFLFPDGD